ncbi:hypothetical protein SEPCBS57363_005360 [Sporothrix epigloea]|uniref:Uncharacterized protein n=1 Tax=Sporothrix epigloea TaxID=1892477 RepID=A0ABP0E027_9PEZI
MAAAAADGLNDLLGDSGAADSTSTLPTASSDGTASDNKNGDTTNSNGPASAKRKRDDSNDGDEAMTDAGASQATTTAGTLVDQIKTAVSASASPALSSLSVNGKSEPTRNGQQATTGLVTSTTAGNRDEKRLIRDYFEVLKSFDTAIPPILTRPLPESTASHQPQRQAKRKKFNDAVSPSSADSLRSISDKVKGDSYALLDDLVLDIAASVRSELHALGAQAAKAEDEITLADNDDDGTKVEKTDSLVGDAKEAKRDDVDADDEKDDITISAPTIDEKAKQAAIAHITKFREAAYDMYRRETAYPISGPLHGKTGGKIGSDEFETISSSSRGKPVLTLFGSAPGPRQLFSSLPMRNSAPNAQSGKDDDNESIEEIIREDMDVAFGSNMTLTRLFPPPQPAKSARVPTFGELFPSPRNLPPLQPPKVPKSTIKSSTLSFYHPELVERSKYRTGSYSSQHINAGQWLDYSNATPSSQIKTRQRARAQSLAGRKPSATELESSEMESLFRGAFSSFAPSKDDSAAIVSAAHAGRMWWQRVGHRVFQRMVETELDGDEHISEASTPEDAVKTGVLDEELLQKTLEEWDESLVDPSLEELMGQKSDVDMDTDDMLQEVSDLIVTLASYQRNRNLTLPTSQDRFSADPVNTDMLRNGTLAQQPSEEEILTYQTLRAQLSLIIQALPPYAVARLNSDKLAELNISTRIEVRGEEYRGILEEEESVVRARQAAQTTQATVSSPQRAPAHIAPNSSVSHNYGPQFSTPSRPPTAATAYYPNQHQTPARAGQPLRASVSGAAGTPATTLPPHIRPGAQTQPQYRPLPNGYASYGPSMVKQQQPVQLRQGPQQVQPSSAFAPVQPAPPHMSPQRAASQLQPGAYGSPAMQSGTPQQFRYPPGTPGFPQQVPLPPQAPGTSQQQQQRPSHSIPYSPSPANSVTHLAPQQHSTVQPPQHAGSPQPRFQQVAMMPGTPQQQQQQQQQFRQPQQIIARPPFASNVATPQGQGTAAQQQPPRQYSGIAAPGGGGGPFGYHTVMDQPQQQRLMEQARARASAHERSTGFADKMTQGSVGQVAGSTGTGPGGGGGTLNNGTDVAKLAAARAHMSAGSTATQRPGQYPPQSQSPFQSPVPPQAYLQQQNKQQQVPRPQGSPSPALIGTPQSHHIPSPSPVSLSVSPAPSGGFSRPN